MLLLLRILLLSGSSFFYSNALSNILRNKCKKNAIFYHIGSNLKMNAKQLGKSTVGTDDECLERCIIHDMCLSINANGTENGKITCTLYANDRNTHSDQLHKKEGYRYYDTGYTTDKIGPKCRGIKENPCNNSICIDSCIDMPSCLKYTGTSCNNIRTKYSKIKLYSGLYTIYNDTIPYKVYCDMETLGGGWQLIGNAQVVHEADIIGIEKTDVRQILSPDTINYIPNPAVMQKLKEVLGFTQVRFYCHKSITNITFHIVTRNNPVGRMAVKYLCDIIDTKPEACSSYFKMVDDNSYLSVNCKDWGKNDFKGKWSSKRLIMNPIRSDFARRVGFTKVKGNCDDSFNNERFDSRGEWKYFVR